MEVPPWLSYLVIIQKAHITAIDPATLLLQPILVLSILELSLAMDEAECRSLGLNRAELLCSSCNDLVQFQLKHLTANCLQCCKDDGRKLEEMVKYPKAILEVCG